MRRRLDLEKLVIIGAGGLGREVKWLVERINDKFETWNLVGFVDDGFPLGTAISGTQVVGGVETLLQANEPLAVVCAVASPTVRKRIIKQISGNSNLSFPTLIDPSVQMSNSVTIGMGCIICLDSLLTVDIRVGDFTILNWDSKVGHDTTIGSSSLFIQAAMYLGMLRLGIRVSWGPVLGNQGITIGESAIVGAGSVVVRDLPARCTAVGVPANPIKFHRDQ